MWISSEKNLRQRHWEKIIEVSSQEQSYIVDNKVKGQILKRVLQETKHAKFSKKRTFLASWYAYVPVRISGYEMFVFRKI